jgi:MFS family permease
MVISLRRWGKTADSLGNRLVFLVNTVIMTIAFLLLAAVPAFATSLWASMAVAALSFLLTGVALAGMGIAQIVRLMHTAPPSHRGPYMGLFFVTNGVVSALASSIAGFILDRFPPLLSLGAVTIDPIRIYFGAMAIALVLTAPMIRRLSRVRERPLRDTLGGLREKRIRR